jgi:hypothetical protein
MEYKNARRVPLQFNARPPSPVEAVAGRRSGFPEALKSIRELKGDTPDARHANMTAKCVRVVDFETTGLDPASSDVIEVGWCDVYEDCRIQGPYSLLVKTDRPIEIEARAAHHIGPEDLTKGVSGSLWKPYLCYNEPTLGRLSAAISGLRGGNRSPMKRFARSAGSCGVAFHPPPRWRPGP